MRNNGTVKYCKHCDKKTYHYPDGSCSSCYAKAYNISTSELGQARRKAVSREDSMIAAAIKEANNE